MAATILPFSGPKTIGEVLDAAFLLFRRGFVKCAVAALAAVIIGQLPTAVDFARGLRGGLDASPDGLSIALSLLAGTINLIIAGALLLRLQKIADGRQPALRAELWQVVRQGPGTLALCLLVLLVYGVMAFGLLSWLAIVIRELAALPAKALGRVLLVPAVWLAIALWFAVPVRILHGCSIGESLRRSLILVRGNWWRTTTILTVALFAVLVFYVLGGLIGVLLAQLIAAADVAVSLLLTAVVTALVGGLFLVLQAALVVVQYADLSVRRYGDDLGARIAALEHNA